MVLFSLVICVIVPVFRPVVRAQFADTTVCKVLIGNKCDCKEDMVVTEAEGRRLADSLRIPFFLTSAKNNINIQEVCVCVFVWRARDLTIVAENVSRDVFAVSGISHFHHWLF